MVPDNNDEKEVSKESDFEVEEQIYRYSIQMPQVPRGESDHFFKEVYCEETNNVAYVQIGYRVVVVSPQIYDLSSVIINDIHCLSEQNFKLIRQGDEIWITSTIAYPFHLIGDLNYNILESHLGESLVKTRSIVQQIIASARKLYNEAESDEQILKIARKQIKQIKKAFKDPNSDY